MQKENVYNIPNTAIKTPRKIKTRRHTSPMFIALGIFLGIYSISLFIPILWAIMTSLKEPHIAYNLDRLGFPKELYFENFMTVFEKFFVEISTGEKILFPEMLVNSLLYAVGNSLIHTIVTFIVAYAVARFNFKIGKVIYFTVILGMILPLVGSQPSMLTLARQLHLYNNMIGQWIMNAHYLGMYFLVFHATLKAYPKDFDEAARIDGASNLGVMIKIMFPLSITTFSTILLLNFIQHWNNYSSPMLFMPDVPTVAYGLRTFDTGNDPYITNTPTRLAACITVAIPTLILFLIFHDRLLNNVSIGGVKE